MEDLKQHYLYEILSLSNDLGIKDYRNDKIDIHFRRVCEDMIEELKGKFNGMSIEINKKIEIQCLEQERSIPLRDIISELPPSIAITSVLPTLEPEDSLIMGDEELSNIPKKESDKFIKSSVKDLVPIPSESEDTSGSDSVYDLPSCDDFSPINVYKEKSVTFSNSLFDSNDDFTSSDDESLSDEDCEDSYDSSLGESTFLVTPLSDSNEDKFFAPGDDIEFLLHRDPSTPTISVVSILVGFIDEPPLKENDDLFDLESKIGDIDEIDAFLDVDISTDIEDGYHDSEGDILYLESLHSNDTILSLPPKVFLDHDLRSLSDINDLKIMDCPDYEDSRARGFVHRPLDLQSFECLWESDILDLIDSRLSISILNKRL
ncbi:hypothetical protein Tco_0567549 [Tanacetum coccineum]